MSAYSMASSAMARKKLEAPLDPTMKSKTLDIAHSAEGKETADTGVSAAIKVITTYIPTEVLTLYVAGVALFLTADSPGETINYRAAWWTFFVFLVVTPAVNWIIFATKFKAAQNKLPWRPTLWPLWEMPAATIAFAAWAFALPQTPFRVYESWYSSDVAGFVVLAVSVVLGLVSPLFHK